MPNRIELFVTTIIHMHRNIDDEANLSLLWYKKALYITLFIWKINYSHIWLIEKHVLWYFLYFYICHLFWLSWIINTFLYSVISLIHYLFYLGDKLMFHKFLLILNRWLTWEWKRYWTRRRGLTLYILCKLSLSYRVLHY